MTLPCTWSCAVFDPYSPCTMQMTGPDSLRVTLWMVNSTQVVSLLKQNLAENSFEDEVMSPLMGTVRTRSPPTCQVMMRHIPCTVALNRTSEPCSTVEFRGSSWNCPGTAEHKRDNSSGGNERQAIEFIIEETEEKKTSSGIMAQASLFWEDVQLHVATLPSPCTE